METELTGIWEEMEFEPGLDLQRVSLRQGAAGELMIMLESALLPELTIEADISVVHLLDHEVVVMAGDSYLHPVVNGKSFQVSANAFFQVNTLVAGKMVMHLLNHLPISTHTTLLDLYCGVGLFSAFFAGQVEQLIGIELSQAACDDFCVNLDPFENVALYQAPVEEVLPLLDYQPEVVILDPPRSGLDKRVLDALQRLSPNHIAYVSCDPSTLARDANRLVNKGYQLKEVTPFDMFPQTHHIESISIFEHIR